MVNSVTLKDLQKLSELSIKHSKNCKKADPSITGLVWRISKTGMVSAAYRHQVFNEKDQSKVFQANMRLNSTAFHAVKKKAM